jgi:hypothetical protein
MNQIGPYGEHGRCFADAGMDIHAERGELRGRKVLGVDPLSTCLDGGIGAKQTGQVQHRDAKRFADEVARLVDGDVVRGCTVAVHDKNPLEAVLRKLSAKIGDK